MSHPGHAAAVDATLRVVLLGNDAIAAAAPATPVQLMHACRAAGFGLVVPPNWGDELVAMEALRQLDGLGRQPAVLVTCPHVAARVEGVPGGPDLALVAIVAPPVAAARHLRRLAGDTRLHLTYVGGCPDAARPDSGIDQRMLPEEFLAALAARGIVPVEQPTLFEDVLPPDRRRWVSLPGGVPMPSAVARRGGHSLVELDGVHAEAAARWRSLVRGSGLVDAAAGLGCACSGALPGRGGTSARARVVSADPPRARTAVLAELPGLNLERRVTLQRATPRASPPRSMPGVEEQAPRPQREPDPAPEPQPDPPSAPPPEPPPMPREAPPETEPPAVVPEEREAPRVDPPAGEPPMRAAASHAPWETPVYVPEPEMAFALDATAEGEAAREAAAPVAYASAERAPGADSATGATPEAAPQPAPRSLLAAPRAVLHTPVRVPSIDIDAARQAARAWLHRPLPPALQLAVMAATIAGVALMARWTRPRAGESPAAPGAVPALRTLVDSAANAASATRTAPAGRPAASPAPVATVPARRTTRSAPGSVAPSRAPARRGRGAVAPADSAAAVTTPATPIVAAPAPVAAPRETTVVAPRPVAPAPSDSASRERDAIRRELEQRRARLDSIQRRVDSLYRTRRPPG